MWLFGFGRKLDSNIKELMKINLKRKLPVIVLYSANQKGVKSKILYNGGKIKYEYNNVNAIACDISPYGIDKLTEIPESRFIILDYKATLCLKNTQDALGLSTARLFNLTGKNIGIGLVDSGVYPHPDLTFSREAVVFFKDLINGFEKPYDDNGHGSFLSGCIAASGYSSSKQYMGISPDACLCVIKAFDASGNGFMSDIIKAIDILIEEREKHNIRIICLPFEFQNLSQFKLNPLEAIIKKSVELGITVIVPSGNFGPQPYSIYSPGNMKEVITVGGVSYDTKQNNSICSFSGRGPTKNGTLKPDIVAPCMNITSLSSNTSYNPMLKIKPVLNTPYTTKSGTSIACAIITGICALILEKTPTLTPQDLKAILGISTVSIKDNKFSQGKGMVTFEKIIK